MSKIAILLPYENMKETVKKVLDEKDYKIDYIKVISTENAVNEAMIAVERGAHIVISRGYQAQLIKKYTNIPLVEMRLHAQEIGLLIQKAKKTTHKAEPVIGLIVFENMLCDISHMEELFSVRLITCYLKRVEEITNIISDMRKKDVDCVIGGDTVCRESERQGMLSIKFGSTEESILDAVKRANGMIYAMESEKHNAAQFETVLDTSFSGIIKVNSEGRIIAVNHLIENLIGKNMEDVNGELLYDVFPQIEKIVIQDILTGEKENHSSSIEIRGKNWMFLAAPIQFDGQITGAILTLHAFTEIVRKDYRTVNDMMYGFTAKTHFQDIYTEDESMKRLLETAKEYALSESPVLIYGNTGTEYYQIAEAIHNSSIRKTGPFVSVDISGIEPESQKEVLFGKENNLANDNMLLKGALARADHGTILINGIEKLKPCVQYQLTRIIMKNTARRTDALLMGFLDTRIIAVTQKAPADLFNAGISNETLYYLLRGLTLNIPPLNVRRKDLKYFIDRYFKRYCQKYNKYLVITKGGYDAMMEFQWPGNVLQIKVFLERLVITASKRSISEGIIRKLYEELYPYTEEENVHKSYPSKEAAQLMELLKKYHGNRKLVASELGISTTTLWRWMNKYGIELKSTENNS